MYVHLLPNNSEQVKTGFTLGDDGPVNAWLSKVRRRSVVIGVTVDLITVLSTSFRKFFFFFFFFLSLYTEEVHLQTFVMI